MAATGAASRDQLRVFSLQFFEKLLTIIQWLKIFHIKRNGFARQSENEEQNRFVLHFLFMRVADDSFVFILALPKNCNSKKKGLGTLLIYIRKSHVFFPLLAATGAASMAQLRMFFALKTRVSFFLYSF